MAEIAPPVAAPQQVFASSGSPPQSPRSIRAYDAPPSQPPSHALPPLLLGQEKRNSVTSIRRKSVPSAPQSPTTPTAAMNSSRHEREQSLDGINEADVAGYGQKWPQRRDSMVLPPGAIPTPRDYEKQLPQFDSRVTSMQSIASRDLATPSPDLILNPPAHDDPRIHEPLASPGYHPQHVTNQMPIPQPQAAVISSGESNRSSGCSYVEAFPVSRADTPASSENTAAQEPRPTKLYPQLQYHHQQFVQTPDSSSLSVNKPPYSRNSSSPASSDGQPVQMRHLDPLAAQRRGSRPISSYSTLSVDNIRANGPRSPGRRAASGAYDLRRSSFVDLTTPAHIEHVPIASNLDNSFLQSSVGENLSLLSIGKTLEMYRQTAKKSNNVEAQYELARFMIEIIHQLPQDEPHSSDSSDGKSNPRNDGLPSRKALVREARQLLERIQRHPNAQYLLGDGFFSGLFNKNVPDHDRAFPLFIAASKHGHAEAGFRAALCYEHGWGCKRDPKKAAMYYETSAVKRHPGAMTRLGIACLNGELGLVGKHREGTKWLKFATEEADVQYPSAPFVYGCLFETGFGEDIFEDPSYAAELFAQAAELGHPEANYRLGDAYEHGKLNCPRDAALSVHYYTTAAQKGHPAAMMALCAWYLVGAEPVLEKNEEEAYIWACKASEFGLPKAEYARGYFTEMGIGCRRDPLEANVWYVRAADHGDERAVARLKIINQAASGGNGNAKDKKKKKKVEQGVESEARGAGSQAPKTLKKEREEGGEKGDCAIM